MYRGTPSPIFDVPEFPTLRRVKPLPKRRRTSAPISERSNPLSLSPATASALAAQGATALLHQSAAAAILQQHHQQLPPSLDTLGPNATAEELLAHADSLTARMALQNYYMPILGGVQNFLAGSASGHGAGNDASNATNAAAAAAAALAAVAGAGRNGQLPPLSELDSIEFGVHFAAAAAAAAAAGVAMGGLGSLGLGLPSMNGMTMGMGAGMGMGMGVAGTNSPTAVLGSGQERVGERESRGREEDGGRGDGDYVDHIRQPGNTKKRKVPANAGSSPRGGDGGDTGRVGSPSGYLDEEGGDGSLVGTGADTEPHRDGGRDRDRDYETIPGSPAYPPPPFPGQLSMLVQKKGKLTAATLAGLQHKEVLKTRKRQLAAVMGALSHGDTLALDQALSANYPFVGGIGSASAGGGSIGENLKIHKSKRKTVRLARAMKLVLETPERRYRHPDAVPFPTGGFLFCCPSATADRLISTKDEVATLRKRFEGELERQAAKAAKMASAAATGSSKTLVKATGGRGKRERQERDRERAARTERQLMAKAITAGNGTNSGGDQTPESVESGVGSIGGLSLGSVLGMAGGKVKNGKKKKRSALANASNPHHLKNYVPSRLPHSGPGDSGPNAQGQANTNNNIWPPPVRFLSAQIPPRRKSKKSGSAKAPPLVQSTNPADEWICAFCEYDLFYGDDASYRRAVRSRKKILKRRRRARERAAAAASGTSTTKIPPPPPEEDYDGYDGTSASGVDEYGSAPPQRGTKIRGGPDKDQTAAVG